MSRHNFQKITFLLSAAKLEQLPIEGAEVAFVGRSNVGKSSAINAITGIRGLAKASNTPGRTQLINLFSFDERHRLVDLPGYGYAKVSQENEANIQHFEIDIANINFFLNAGGVNACIGPYQQEKHDKLEKDKKERRLGKNM